jgi:hypothetical protein
MNNELKKIYKKIENLKTDIHTKCVEMEIFDPPLFKTEDSNAIIHKKIEHCYGEFKSEFFQYLTQNHSKIVKSLKRKNPEKNKSEDKLTEKDNIDFEKYLVSTYTQLKNSINSNDETHFESILKNKDYFFNNFEEYVFFAITSDFQTIFFKPVISSIERDYYEILMHHGFLPTPIESFLRAISAFNIILEKSDITDPYQPKVIVNNQSIPVDTYFNGFYFESENRQYLEKLFIKFKDFINNEIKTPDKYFEFSNSLLNLKTELKLLTGTYKEHLSSNYVGYDKLYFNTKINYSFNPESIKFSFPVDYDDRHNSIFLFDQREFTILALEFVTDKIDLLKALPLPSQGSMDQIQVDKNENLIKSHPQSPKLSPEDVITEPQLSASNDLISFTNEIENKRVLPLYELDKIFPYSNNSYKILLFNIDKESDKITDLQEKYNFFYKKRVNFIASRNSGTDADNALAWFDRKLNVLNQLIYIEKNSLKQVEVPSASIDHIQNMEYSLNSIRYLFLLQLKEGVQVDQITLIPNFDFLNGSAFKVAALDYSIKFYNPILRNKLIRIYEFSNEIVNIWNNNLSNLKTGRHAKKEYKIICSPIKNLDFPFDDYYLLQYHWQDKNQIISEGNFYIEDNRYWKILDKFDLKEIENLTKNTKHQNGFPFQFADFSSQISYFLQTEILKYNSKSTPHPKPDNISKTFPEYLLHSENILLAEKLKSEFKTEKGKGVRLMLDVLIDRTILVVENRKKKTIYLSLKSFFDRDIGTYQGIWDYKRNGDDLDYKSIEVRINYILENLTK